MANLIVTNGGIATIRNAQATGTNAVRIASVRIGSGKWTPTGAATALKTPIKSYTAIAGGAIGDNIIHVEALDQSADAFTAYEVGVFLADGTMLAVASSTTPILVKAAGSQAMLAVDIVISDIGTTTFVFPSASFLVPVATTEIQGIVELATVAEGLAGTDIYRAMTPADVKAVADTKANVNHASTANSYGPATGSNYGHVRLSDSTGSSSSTTGGYAATPKAVKDAKEACIQADTLKVAKAGDTVTGAIHSTAGKAVVNGSSTEQFGGEMASSDKWRLAAGGTASDAGFVALDTADNGNEPILVRQYSGDFATLVRQAELLDASGDTSFPGEVTASGGFTGNLEGTARDATRLTTARNLTIKDNSQTNSGPAQSFNGTSNAVLRLPATIKAELDGNARSAGQLKTARKINGTDFDGTAAITTAKWGTARDLSIADADGSNTGAAVSVDGGAAKTLKLPATIKAELDGNARTAAAWKTARNFTVADATGSNTGAASSVNGGANVTLKLPATIKAEIDGNARSAGQLKTARKINGTAFNGTADITTAKWGTSRNISISDADGSHTGTAVAVDGSAAKTLKLPATIKASLDGNASSASRLAAAVTLTVKDNDQSNAGPAQSFDGASSVSLRLPAVIKGTLDGNAATATRALQDGAGLQIDTGYLKLSGGTVSGPLVLSRTTDASGTGTAVPALSIGNVSGEHLELDGNELMAKGNANTPGTLYLNRDGGAVLAEGTRVVKGASKGGTVKGIYIDANGFAQEMAATVGGTAKGVYLNGGTVTAMSATVGGAAQPVFMQSGELKACNAYSTVSMVPTGNPEGRNRYTTYTAETNGFVVVGSDGGYVYAYDVVINGYVYTMKHTAYGSWNPGERNFTVFPCRKGWQYRLNCDNGRAWLCWQPCA